MSGFSRKLQVLIVADSRGAWLSRELGNSLHYNQINGVNYHVMYKKDAGLATQWELAEYALFTRKVDILMILGGICEPSYSIPLTLLYKHGK